MNYKEQELYSRRISGIPRNRRTHQARIELSPEQKTRLEKIIHQTIIHAGDNNTMSMGNDNSFSS